MRLKTSKNSAEEQVIQALNLGYRVAPEILQDYRTKQKSQTYDSKEDLAFYNKQFLEWINNTSLVLLDIFPTPLEANMFSEMTSFKAAHYENIDSAVGSLIYAKIPAYINRLSQILNSSLQKYSDLPIKERIYIEDIDSFIKVRDVNPAMVTRFLDDGRIELSEDEVQFLFEHILNVPFHKKDWGGETNDLYTANLILNGARRSAAFLLKGNGLKKDKMTIADCGKNGDQIIRLFQSPADIFIVQYIGQIAEAVIADVHEKVRLNRLDGRSSNYLIIDGQDTARLMFAHNRLI